MNSTIFLRGVVIDNNSTKNIKVEEVNKPKLRDKPQEPVNKSSIFDGEFSDLSQLPNEFNTVMCCWYCTLNIEEPVYLVRKNDDHIKMKAVFCSFTCGFQWVNDLNDKQKSQKYFRLLQEYFILKTGYLPKSISKAPNKYELAKFGGSKSNEEFKEILNDLEEKLLKESIKTTNSLF